MKVVFFSNFMNHHQLPFCLAMNKLLNGEFIFVANEKIPDERIKLGYENMNDKYSFVLTAYANEEKKQEAFFLADVCDVAIIGSAPDEYIVNRLEKGKLTFRYSERFYKGKYNNVFYIPKMWFWNFRKNRKFRNKPLYMLCASAYTAYDCTKFGDFKEKTYKWGYFPEVKTQDINRLFQIKNKTPKKTILWVGRLIKWKHPEVAIFVAEKLKSQGIDFQCILIGNGAMEDELNELIEHKNLTDCVKMLGAMSPDKVRQYMEEANVFLFTSDSNEGWGAVLNEAMNSCCSIVASHAIGSVPFLIKDKKNGLIYRDGDIEDASDKVLYLLKNEEERYCLGVNAYNTLIDEWNADIAAERFIVLSKELIINKECNKYKSGPCSRAGILKNGWYKGE